MWLLTENPWPLIIVLSVVAVGLVVSWWTRRDNRLLVATVVVVLLAVGAWELERRIVTEKERLTARVLDLRDAVQAKDGEFAELFGFFSNSEPALKVMATAGLRLVTFEDRIRHAAGRLDESYPTSKMMGGGPDQWKQVGTVKYISNLGWLIDDITDEESLYGWDPGPHYAGGSPALHEEARIKQINEDIRNGRIPAPWK